MGSFVQIIFNALVQTGTTFLHNWPFLLISICISAALKLFLDPQKVSAFMMRHRQAGVLGATMAAVATPLCSCGTTAVILGMLASTMPWAPIIAFMVASPLTSPEELVYSAGLFGWPFALAFFAASILLGLLGGAAAGILENRGWLANQSRLASPTGISSKMVDSGETSCGCPQTTEFVPVMVPAMTPAIAACACPRENGAPVAAFQGTLLAHESHAIAVQTGCGCDSHVPAPQLQTCSCASATGDPALVEAERQKPPITPRLFLSELLVSGKRLLIMFAGFAFIGYLLNGLIPPAWVEAVFGGGSLYSVPLAATLGLPLYVNTEASLPLVRALIDGGMSQGAALAFLITGAGTSFGALAGALTIARWRVIAVVIGTLWVGAIVLGTLYNLLLVSGLLP